MNEKPASTIRSVEISCNILGALEDTGAVGVSELATELGHSKSTVHDHLMTLKTNQLVVHDTEGYRLSLRFIALAEQVKKQHSNYSVVEEAVDELASEVNERAQFGCRSYDKLIYLCRSRGNTEKNRHFYPSVEEPLHCTALGKSILAFTPQEQVDEIIDHQGLEKRTSNTITDYDELMSELEEIREQNYAISDEELANGMRCVAAPVTGDDTVIGSIGVSGPVSRLDDERLDSELAVQVRRVANVIEINSMFSG